MRKKMTIYLFQKVQIQTLLFDKTFIIILLKNFD